MNFNYLKPTSSLWTPLETSRKMQTDTSAFVEMSPNTTWDYCLGRVFHMVTWEIFPKTDPIRAKLKIKLKGDKPSAPPILLSWPFAKNSLLTSLCHCRCCSLCQKFPPHLHFLYPKPKQKIWYTLGTILVWVFPETNSETRIHLQVVYLGNTV